MTNNNRPPLFFTSLPLPQIVVNTNRRTENGERLGTMQCAYTCVCVMYMYLHVPPLEDRGQDGTKTETGNLVQ